MVHEAYQYFRYKYKVKPNVEKQLLKARKLKGETAKTEDDKQKTDDENQETEENTRKITMGITSILDLCNFS